MPRRVRAWFTQRYVRMNFTAPARSRQNIEVPTNQPESLLHTTQTQTASLSGALASDCGIETNAVIANGDVHCFCLSPQLHPDVLRLGMLDHIGQRLLYDTKAGGLDYRVESGH